LEFTAVTSRAIEGPARCFYQWLECAWHRSPRRMEAVRHGSSVIDVQPTRGRERPAAAATVRRPPPASLRRRTGNLPAALRRRVGNFPAPPTRDFQRAPGIGRLWEPARPPHRNDQGRRNLKRRSEGLGRDRGEGTDGEGISGSAVTYAAHNTIFTRRGPAGRWPPRAR
jgi:hypothetical protein